ncbi:MAG TPA: hypothetical protein VHL34_21425 [Rhizomicrobium sp.]|jgi:hypothetical protein|nr:hypothetical protein [Rhizomicrobium sp.]
MKQTLSQVKALREISAIRSLQTSAAEADAARAAKAADERRREHAAALSQQEALDAGWREGLSGASLRLETSILWSRAASAHQAKVALAEQQSELADDRARQLLTELYAARRRQEDVEEKAVDAERRWVEDREQVFIEALLDVCPLAKDGQ